MNVIIPPKRRDGSTSFLKLVAYISVRDDKSSDQDLVTDSPKNSPSQSKQAVFDRLVDYIDRTGSDDAFVKVMEEFSDGRQRVMTGEVPCETNCFSWETSAAEMNMVASQNRHCVDPVYHFILSWREHEAPTNAQVFESAQHCINALGMEGHQYVTAIHNDTDNLHCHVAVNRVNPTTFKATNMWNDAEKLQKCCRVLERRYGFEQDNGSWVWNDRDVLVPAPFRFSSAPHGAGKTQAYSDKESLFHYTVRTVRDGVDQALDGALTSWDPFHLLMHKNGLGMREQGGGLVVYNVHDPDAAPVKASSVHPSLTKFRLEPHLGAFKQMEVPATDDPFAGRYGVIEAYQPKLQLRDKDARAERRQERAEAREDLKSRFQVYRSAWVKPDVGRIAREQEIALRYRSMKLGVRRSQRDPLLRKLMYRVAEFERMKAMAELRIQLRKERQVLADSGSLRPMSYRNWVEQQALTGDVAAVSQLRGWAYREKRKARTIDNDIDGMIIFAAADDSPVFDLHSHATQLRRDGSIEYLRYGQVGVVDRGDTVELRAGFDDIDSQANLTVAAGLASIKSGEHVEVVGDGQFVDQVLTAGAIASIRDGHDFPLSDPDQRARFEHIEEQVNQPNAVHQVGYTEAAGQGDFDSFDPNEDLNSWKPGL